MLFLHAPSFASPTRSRQCCATGPPAAADGELIISPVLEVALTLLASHPVVWTRREGDGAVPGKRCGPGAGQVLDEGSPYGLSMKEEAHEDKRQEEQGDR